MTGQNDNTHGDADGDGTVDQGDLAEWSAQYSSTPGSVSAFLAVPEPRTLAGPIIFCTLLLSRCRSSRRS